jgi:signal peptidase
VYTFAQFDTLRSFIGIGANDIAAFIFANFLPALALNILLTCIAFDGALASLLLLRAAYSLTPIFLPVLPHVNSTVWASVECVLIFTTLIIYRSILGKHSKPQAIIQKRRERCRRWPVFSFLTTLALAALLLTFSSRMFLYYPAAVLSDSMNDVVPRGSIVFVRKLSEQDINELVNVGDIISYRFGNIEIMHRVIELRYNAIGDRVYITKGDANATADAYVVESWQIVGVVRSQIRYIGYPAVWFKTIFQ